MTQAFPLHWPHGFHHPDRAGDPARFNTVTDAIAAARQALAA